jgi:hypothetical protein
MMRGRRYREAIRSAPSQWGSCAGALLSGPPGPQQHVNQGQFDGHDGGERIFEDHGALLFWSDSAVGKRWKHPISLRTVGALVTCY